MPKEIIFFKEKKFSLKNNFFKLMNILIISQSSSLIEAIIINAINHLQILSAFYSKQIKVFNPDKYKSDKILYIIQSLLRIKDLFRNNYTGLEILNYIILIFLIIFSLCFFLLVYNIKMNYIIFNINITNFIIKIFMFYLYTISLDISFSQMCFGKKEKNPNFEEDIECFGKNKYMIIIPILTIIISFLNHQIFRIYYYESFFISNFFFAKLNSYYDIFMEFNYFINSILLIQAPFLHRRFFLYYNLIFSIFIFIYYFRNYIYYNSYMNLFTGLFHIIYIISTIFSLFSFYIDFDEKGFIYIVTCIIAGFIFYKIKIIREEKILYDISINKINNTNYLLVYIKTLTDLLIKYENKNEMRGLIAGLLNQLIKESPNKICDELIKEQMYIPLTNEWRDIKKEKVTDKVFIKYFIVIIYHYFLISKNFCPEIYLNLSHYYLNIIGNYCKAMYYCQKLFEFNLNSQQEFAFYRLKLEITKALTKKYKESNELNISLENVNISTYYQYENLRENLLEEINNDIELSLKFWKLFKEIHRNVEFKLNFNEVFKISEKIQIKKNNIEKIFNNVMKEYSGINDYFELYNEYIVQINDDDIKKRELDTFKKNIINKEEDFNNNYYSILFDKETGIIIVSKDKGTEGIIKHYNKRIEKIFKYSDQELKEKNINILMPKIIEKKHSHFMENYFKTGFNKYIEKKEFKTFAKAKNNSIFQIRLALKLLPYLNYNVIFVGMIIKENINDIIFVDENFIIQGMCDKLKENLNIHNDYIFQYNEIPFYLICKKFINFYKMFLSNKKKESENNNKQMNMNELIIKKTNTTEFNKINVSSKRKGETTEEENIKKEKENLINKQLQENIEINENFELEFEIQLPQFLINYSNKIKQEKKANHHKNKIIKEESIDNDDDDIDEDDEDNELLLSNCSKQKMKKRKIPPTPTPTQNYPLNLTILNLQQEKIILNRSEEEKIFYERMEKVDDLFKEEKYEDLEDLIDSYNKEPTLFAEYKFNFTFDKYNFGDNNISYIIRCIDNKKTDGQSDEKSFDLEPNMIRYRKNKEQSIKPLYEITMEEREETIKYPKQFFKLLENEKFRAILEENKEEINKMSKIKGNHKDNILDHDNGSRSFSHSGFENDLMKNKIGEIRSNLFQNMPEYFTVKYIQIVIFCIFFTTIIFSLGFFFFIYDLYNSLKEISLMNLNLFKASSKTIDLIGILISLKALILKKIENKNYEYLNYISNEIKTNEDYYEEMVKIGSELYLELNNEYGYLNMFIPKYISEQNLLNIYWDHINISYLNDLYIRNNRIGNESFPNAIHQFLFNTISFLKKYNISDNNDINNNKDYFYYITFLIIENPYINIIPNLFIKLEKIPEIYSEYNITQKKYIYLIIFIYISFQVIICLIHTLLIRSTNYSMSEIFKKLTKIKFEKIDETIKKIEKFLSHLKNFREMLTEDDEELKEINIDKNQNKRNSIYQRHSVHFNLMNKSDISHISNNGFNTDQKNYYPLTILRNYFIHSILFIGVLCAFIIPLYIYSINVINVINRLMLIVNYIYGKLMNTSLTIVELKCYIIECKTRNHSLSYEHLGSNDNIQLFVKGIRNFKNIENFYDNKFMLNACEAAINKEKERDKYNMCINDSVVNNANNTDNIMEILTSFIENLYKRDIMEKGNLNNNNKYFRQMLFNDTDYQEIEYLFFNYIFTVAQIFEDTVKSSLDDYIKDNKLLLVIILFVFCITMTFYNIIYLILFIPKLIYLINVSRGIIKIIPTSVIVNTPELQSYIGNKYSKY